MWMRERMAIFTVAIYYQEDGILYAVGNEPSRTRTHVSSLTTNGQTEGKIGVSKTKPSGVSARR
jgi:hypothetical protein